MNKRRLAIVLSGALALVVSVGVISGAFAAETDSVVLAPGAPGVDYSNQSF